MDGVSIDALRAHLATAGVRLTVSGDTLRVIAPAGTLTPALRQAITDHKPALIEALTGYRYLDAAIIASEAGRRPPDEIENRLRRLTARAAEPTATPRDHQLARDWTAIREAKRRLNLAA